MLSFEEALAEVLAQCAPLPPESVPLSAAAGRYLAEPLLALSDLPRYACSAVDGYGVRVADVAAASSEHPARLKLAGTVFAGEVYEGALRDGAAIKLMTGAAVPAGVEAIVMREAAVEEAHVAILRAAEPGENIRRQGSDCHAGGLLAPAGSLITPPLAALIAAQGMAQVRAHGMPAICLMATGSELAAPGAELGPGQMYDSNTAGLQAALAGMGLKVSAQATCPDDQQVIARRLDGFMLSADVIICVGGVSVGDRDYVPQACMQIGMQTRFHGVAVKPGKPVLCATFSRRDGKQGLFFGLPGNPVSALVLFEQLVRPALLRLQGAQGTGASRARAELTAGISKNAGRLEFARGVAAVTGDVLRVTPLAERESHQLAGLARANCLIRLPRDATCLPAGGLVDIEWLSWAGAGAAAAAQGIVVAVSVSEHKGERKHNVPSVRLRADWGIEGDAHAGAEGRQVSLLAQESIDKMRALGLNVGPGVFAENVTTCGIDLLRLSAGDHISIGATELEVTQIGKQCHSRCAIYEQAGDCVMPREGVFARVLRGGEIRPGDAVQLLGSGSAGGLPAGGTDG